MKKTNKELTAKDIAQRRKILVFPLIGLAFLGFLYFVFNLSPKDKGNSNKPEEIKGFVVDMPDPTSSEITPDKRKAYEQDHLQQKQDEKLRSLQDYAFSLGKETSDMEEKEFDLTIEDKTEEVSIDLGLQKPINSIQASNLAHSNMQRELNNFYQPSQSDTERKRLENKIEELQRRLDAAESGENNNPEKLMEKSYQMAAKYFNVGAEQTKEEKPVTIPAKTEKTHLYAVSNVKENVVSRLNQPVSDSAFLSEYSKDRNWGFNSVGTPEQENMKNTIRGCVLEKHVLYFGTEEVPKIRFRLLENVKANNIFLPRNTIISGDAKLERGRVEITINSIEYNEIILPVKLAVYDLDGQRGITAPNSMETSAVKEAAGNVGSGLGTSISVSQNAGQQAAMDLTKAVTQTGSQYVSKKLKTNKVTIKAGHEVFFLSEVN